MCTPTKGKLLGQRSQRQTWQDKVVSRKREREVAVIGPDGFKAKQMVKEKEKNHSLTL